ncbi:uncharacterized protein LOC134195941 [Corticium candelabrum]|uniref:uncharacterized protein LOC134195941 n=1 Tax=Corticium candelabrum TaxID=121492 RepID=UPI002E269D74|nr:uncharacterized protein LOC134195941 [Corticium candelabrum]
MVSAWSDCLSQLQLHHVKEPRGRYVNSEDRSDIVVFDSASGMDLELDIALAHPWSNELEGLSATTQRAAATRRENLKIKKYDQELLPGGFRPTFVPIVFEHFGCWGEKAEDYFEETATAIKRRRRKAKCINLQDILEICVLCVSTTIKC